MLDIGKINCIANWSTVKDIGSGCSARVKLAYDPVLNIFAAIKIARTDSRSHKQAMANETNVMKKLNHKHIAKIFDSYTDIDLEDDQGNQKQLSAIVMEFVPKGELFEFISKTGRVEERIARYHFQQLIDAVEYCHKKGIVHRDLKPENLLLDMDYSIKMIDFGYSKSFGNKSSSSVVGCVGTDAYMAPEVFFHQAYDGQKADIFSVGVILFLMVVGHLPFTRADPKDPLYKVFISNNTNSFWQQHEKEMRKAGSNFILSENFKDLIAGLLAIDSEERLSLDEIKKHIWNLGPVISKEELKEEFDQRSTIVKPLLEEVVMNKQDLLENIEDPVSIPREKPKIFQVLKIATNSPRHSESPLPSKEESIKFTSISQLASPGLPTISFN